MKKQIVERLLKDGHINFDEALELMQSEKEVVREFVIQPQQQIPVVINPHITAPYIPSYPGQPWYVNPQITC